MSRSIRQIAIRTPVLIAALTSLSHAATTQSVATDSDDTSFGFATVSLINEHVRQGWQDHNLKPSRAATDGEWCRRVHLDLIGRVPTVDELQAYLGDRSRRRQLHLVNRLLSEEYQEQYARHWTAVWTNTLIGRTGGTTDDSLASRAGMQQYLGESFQSNKPYDQMVRELITATGSCRPGDVDFNGAANFLADKLDDRGIQATAKTAQVFLGMAVQCTQCHDHPFNEHRQNQFWELNAFYRQTGVERVRDADMDRSFARIVDRDFAGERERRHWQARGEIVWEQVGGELVDSGASARAAAHVSYELRNGKQKIAYPVFVDGTSLEEYFLDLGSEFGNSGFLEHVNRRQELARLVLSSQALDRAIVNRMWARLLGYGFTSPVDDMGPHTLPSHPNLLDALARAFRDSGYDLKQLMRWIALSEPYGLSSRMTRTNQRDDPALGVRPMFSHFYMRQMEAEQLYESLLVTTGAADTLAYDDRQQVKQRWLNQFNTAFGTDENDESTTFDGSIPQSLMMMNGELIRKATGWEEGSMLVWVAQDAGLSNAEKIRHLYLAALARRPSRDELALSNQLLIARQGNVVAALQDIWWALLNTNEFILVH